MDPLKPLIDALHAQGRLRVWSLVITVFGDMVQHRGGVISTARLGALMSRIGVEPGTLRTALSRLGRDGWVESERTGRTSLYRLSPQGVERFAPATSLIYAAPQTEPVQNWSLYVTLDGATPTIGLVPAGRVPERADCVVTGSLDQISPAYRERVLGDEMRAAIEALAADVDALRSNAPSDQLDAAAARVLLIHRWRRLVLRHPEPVPDLMPEDIGLTNPRAEIAALYRSLSPLAEAWLDQPLEGLPAMPAASPDFAARFGGAVGS
ncbi:PaaX family transcriptional regulator C-terminal domain-containing protein [Aestuariivita boseongensis]|uniref:PaaX family transcriptional regulator C-terminal domain-containing protein n=1 Tax=Aestuariivita boseongensis TaxID=1470562 RepID=UPI0006809B1F|nr:PaaX family transcriptional regulator C-terminal domain-containing protein [Aestuariivita boseongensis]